MPTHIPAPYSMTKTPVGMPDGRTLNYYDFAPDNVPAEYLALHQQAARE